MKKTSINVNEIKRHCYLKYIVKSRKNFRYLKPGSANLKKTIKLPESYLDIPLRSIVSSIGKYSFPLNSNSFGRPILKQLILFLMVLFPISCNVQAYIWPAGVKVALEFENNTVNTGNGVYTFSNTGNTPFSTAVFADGTYSAGIFNKAGQGINGDQRITDYIRTIQCNVYQASKGTPENGYIWMIDSAKASMYIYKGNLYYSDIDNGNLGPYHISKNKWHLLTANYDGAGVELFMDGSRLGSMKSHQPGTSDGDIICIGHYFGHDSQFNGYVDDFIMSTDNSLGARILPLNPIDTPTPDAQKTAEAIQTRDVQAAERREQHKLALRATRTQIAAEKTRIAVLSFTPTPAAAISLCKAPFPAVFTQNPTPVFIPETAYEQTFVGEPNIITGPDGLLHMTYSCNAFDKKGLQETIGLATATNPDGPWKRFGNSPIIGGGYGGVDTACGMSSQVHIGNEWRIYFSRHISGAVEYETSTDGYHYTYGGIALSTDQFIRTECKLALPTDGMGVFYSGTRLMGMVEVATGSCPVLSQYVLWLCESYDNGLTFRLKSPEALKGINPFAPKLHLYAGGRSTVLAGNHWHSWPHVDYPTNIYHSESSDLYNWKSDPVPVVILTEHTFGLKACNQVADTCIIEYKGNTYLFYDATDNVNGAGAIGYSVYHGTLAMYDACVNPDKNGK